MILNQFLSSIELKKTLLKDQFMHLEFILEGLDVDKKMSIFNDLEFLGQIHHSINIDQYQSARLREKLLISSPPYLIDKYFKMCKLSKTFSNMTNDELNQNIKNICKFDWSDNIETHRFVECFNYPDYIIPKNYNVEKTVESIYGNNITPNTFEPLKMLLEYQAKIVYQALDKLEIPKARFLIQMPTGTGKTRTAMEILGHYLNQHKEHQVVWLAHSAELLSQAADTFKHVWNHVGKYSIKIYRIWGDQKIPTINTNTSVVFAGYEKLRNYLKNRNIMKPNLIVIDEAHRISAPKYDELLEELATFEKNTKVFGLSATPGRGIDEQQNKLLADKFHMQLLGIELNNKLVERYEENTVEYLEDQKILAKVKPEPLETNYEYELSNDEWEQLEKLYHGDRKEFNTKLLKELAEDNKRNILIINALKKYANEGKKILYFSTDVQQSILVTIVLTKLKIRAVHVSATTDKKFRKEIIEKFTNTDEISVICNYNIFSTGFDVPNLDVVFIGRPINSPVLFNQIVGRGTRGIRMGGKESFTLVQVIDKISNEFNFDPYRHYAFWDKNWKK